MFSLLSTLSGNTKMRKSTVHGYASYILHLAPHTLGGYKTVCPKSTPGCRAACLNTAGHGGMFKPDGTNRVQDARIRRTKRFFENRKDFMFDLTCDITKAMRQANRLGLEPVFRLNGTSDILWERIPVLGYKNIFEMFSAVQFYDYTKILRSIDIPNYHLTFSLSESNRHELELAIKSGMSIAAVFNKVPEYYHGFKVLDGDLHDLRFLDTQSFVGLKAKGRARKDESGFVIRV
jgi:hypothetical protein